RVGNALVDWITDELEAALTPAATPRGEEVPSRSRLRRIAAEKGEPAPRFDASEDGLPEEIEAIVCPLEDDAAAMLERLPDDGTAHTMQAAAALIRRLAASGQGVEAIKTLATGSNSVEVYGPGNHGGKLPWLVAVR